jgi:dynein heavy chain
MTAKKITRLSVAAAKIWEWVLAMEKYAKCYRDVKPKKMKVAVLTEKLNNSRKML